MGEPCLAQPHCDAVARNVQDRSSSSHQREDLNPVEEARAYQKLADDEGMTQAEIAKLVDKSRSHVANFQRLLALPDTVLTFLAEGSLSMGHARALIGRDDAPEMAQKAVSEGLSVRQMEALTRKPRKSGSGEKARPEQTTDGNAEIGRASCRERV